MKRIVVAVAVVVLFFVSNAFAETTGDLSWDKATSKDSSYLSHNHSYKGFNEDNYGVGLDLIMWENDITSVGIEYRRDIENKGDTFYAVGKVNLWKMLNGK